MTSVPDRLFFSKHSSALASLAALEEVGRPFESVRVVMHPGGAGDAAFATINPRRQVPVLVSGSETVRENGAIFAFLAETYPQSNLLPPDVAGRKAVAEWVGYLGGTLHPAFRLIFRPARWIGEDEAARAALRKHTEVYLRRLLTQLDAELTDHSWVLAERSALDFYLFVFTRWSQMVGIPLGEALADHHRRVESLPAMQRALAREAADPTL